jgi:hypothetical protein
MLNDIVRFVWRADDGKWSQSPKLQTLGFFAARAEEEVSCD